MYSVHGYHKLLIWQKAKNLISHIYKVTESFPNSEIFGITSQLRRASVSVALNIVEGHRRESKKEFIHFLDIADGSLTEVEACIEIATELSYISVTDNAELIKEVIELNNMLASFTKAVRSKR